jgi:hypothetical protein
MQQCFWLIIGRAAVSSKTMAKPIRNSHLKSKRVRARLEKRVNQAIVHDQKVWFTHI